MSARSVDEAAERPVSAPQMTCPPLLSCSAEAPAHAPVARKSAEVEALWVKSVVLVLFVVVERVIFAPTAVRFWVVSLVDDAFRMFAFVA